MAQSNFVIVKTRFGNVYCGYVEDRGAGYARLSEARNIWRWRGANTLNELANNGADMKEYTRISEPAQGSVDVVDAEVILECTSKAEENLKQSRWL